MNAFTRADSNGAAYKRVTASTPLQSARGTAVASKRTARRVSERGNGNRKALVPRQEEEGNWQVE